jgi:phenylacetate-coenzyme A ligase PaaK-like adenylate-forming protein
MGASPPNGDKIVLYDYNLIFEFFLDHTLITNLFNYTLPLIRYRMADVLRPVDSAEHAPYLVIESLVGRNELLPKFKNRDGVEDFISPHTINEIFVAGVTRFQLQITGDTEFRFMIVLDPALSPDARTAASDAVAARLREILARKRMDNARFAVVPTDDLPVNPRTRKFQLIVDRRAQPVGS